MKKELQNGYIALIVVSFFWGTTYIASRIGVRHMPGLFLSGVRQFFSGLIMVSFFLIKGFKLPTKSDLKKISIQGIFLLCVANGLLTWSLQYISSGLAAIISALVPLFIVLFSILISKRTIITRWMLLGLAIGFVGILAIFYNYIEQFGNKQFIIGIVLALLAVLSWSFGTVYTAKQKISIYILFNVGLQMLIAGISIVSNLFQLRELCKPCQYRSCLMVCIIIFDFFRIITCLFCLCNCYNKSSTNIGFNICIY